jgi:hypothetical protein
MAVDLSDLVESLQREVNAPGIDQLPDATTAQYTGNLSDSFWQAKLEGLITGYTESDGIVTPEDTVNGVDLPREQQQLIVFMAGMRIITNQLRDMKTTFRAKAGPVEYETQQSANLLVEILKNLRSQKASILDYLAEHGATSVTIIDAVRYRDYLMSEGLTDWIGY